MSFNKMLAAVYLVVSHTIKKSCLEPSLNYISTNMGFIESFLQLSPFTQAGMLTLGDVQPTEYIYKSMTG